jgi:hypothetical protein
MTMTPEREAEIRDVDRVASRADLLRDVRDLLDAIDEAQAALVALREAAQDALDHAPTAEGGTFHAALVEMTRLAATPAALAGQVRARVLREAADTYDNEVDGQRDSTWVAEWLRDHAERAK